MTPVPDEMTTEESSAQTNQVSSKPQNDFAFNEDVRSNDSDSSITSASQVDTKSTEKQEPAKNLTRTTTSVLTTEKNRARSSTVRTVNYSFEPIFTDETTLLPDPVTIQANLVQTSTVPALIFDEDTFHIKTKHNLTSTLEQIFNNENSRGETNPKASATENPFLTTSSFATLELQTESLLQPRDATDDPMVQSEESVSFAPRLKGHVISEVLPLKEQKENQTKIQVHNDQINIPINSVADPSEPVNPVDNLANPEPVNLELLKIEVSPGQWILTRDRATADHFVQVQSKNIIELEGKRKIYHHSKTGKMKLFILKIK